MRGGITVFRLVLSWLCVVNDVAAEVRCVTWTALPSMKQGQRDRGTETEATLSVTAATILSAAGKHDPDMQLVDAGAFVYLHRAGCDLCQSSRVKDRVRDGDRLYRGNDPLCDRETRP